MKRRQFLVGAAALAAYSKIEKSSAGCDTHRLLCLGNKAGASGARDAPQTTAFLARANAITTLDATHANAYTALINGGVSDGWFAKLDLLYIFGTQSNGVALLNLIQNQYNGSIVGSPTFTADQGFTGAAVSCINSNFNPTMAISPKFIQDSASLGAWSLTAGVETGGAIAGADSATNNTTIYPDFGGPGTYIRINDSTGSGQISATPDGSGFYLGSRTSSSNRDGYWNGASIGNANSAVSQGPDNFTAAFGATNSSPSAPSTKKIFSGVMGGALTSTDASKLYSRLRAFATAVGIP